MTKQQKAKEVRKQIQEMITSALPTLERKLTSALNSRSIPDDYLEPNNYLLAKAILDSWCRDRNYAGLNSRTRKEFDNIHIL